MRDEGNAHRTFSPTIVDWSTQEILGLEAGPPRKIGTKYAGRQDDRGVHDEMLMAGP